MKKENKLEFYGAIWDNSTWSMYFDHEFEEIDACKHCTLISKVGKTKKWVCPRVVVARNQGGYDSTGVCADCVVEAVKSLDKKNHATID